MKIHKSVYLIKLLQLGLPFGVSGRTNLEQLHSKVEFTGACFDLQPEIPIKHEALEPGRRLKLL